MTGIATDFTQFSELRYDADRNDPAALREVAGQFEALFLQTMLKSMRDASPEDPLFGDSESLEMYEGMLDQQLAMEMASGRGIGLADVLVRQIGGSDAVADRPASFRPEVYAGPGAPVRRSHAAAPELAPRWESPESFARDLWPHVERVAKQLNVAPEGVLAQAALETGWGQHVPVDASGRSSLNLFGIKAGQSWDGDSVQKRTIEFEGGVARQETARFRAYRDVGESVADYLNLLADNPRYAAVVDHGDNVAGFASALQESGYATDPAYADKISRVAGSETMARVLDGLKVPSAAPIAH